MQHALEPSLTAFVQNQLGNALHVDFVGWEHAESRVWKIDATDGTFFLKAHRQPRKFQQELFAYENWVPHLPNLTPRLVAVHTKSPTALLMTSVPGTVAESKALTTNQRLDMHRDAGRFLKSMHDLPFVDNDISAADAYQLRLESWIVRARGHLEPDEIDWVTRQVTDALPALTDLNRVPSHRDFTPRNWLIEGSGQIHIIDFEHSRPDLWFLDIERLWSRQWLDHPECAAAFWEGYKRVPTEDELRLLAQCATLSALSTIVWAREHSDAAFELQGRRSLDRLRRML